MGTGRNLWSRAETVLALGVAVELSRDAHRADPLVADLSHLLRGAGGDVASRYRNEHGVACKVRRLSALLDGFVMGGGAQLERTVHAEYADRPAALAAAVAAARASLGSPLDPAPSHGPVPAFGETVVFRDDGATWVYLARLGGSLLSDGRLLAKIGRSADVARRMGELNGCLPAPLGLRWRVAATWRYPDAASAHSAEQAMLARAGASGWSVGGEFIAVDANMLTAIIEAGPPFTGRCARPQPPSARAPRAMRRGGRRCRARRRG